MSSEVWLITEQGMFTKDELEASQRRRVAEMTLKPRKPTAELPNLPNVTPPTISVNSIQEEKTTMSNTPERDVQKRLEQGEALLVIEDGEFDYCYPSGMPVAKTLTAQMISDGTLAEQQAGRVYRHKDMLGKPVPEVTKLPETKVTEMKTSQRQLVRNSYGYDAKTGRYSQEAVDKAKRIMQSAGR